MTIKQDKKEQGSVTSDGALYESIKSDFSSFRLRYTMATFRHCVDNNISLDDLREYTPKNLLDVVILGTENISVDEADKVIETWMSKKHTLPMLHILCLEAIKASGFFFSETDLETMGQMVETDNNLLGLILPAINKDMTSIANSVQQLGKVF